MAKIPLTKLAKPQPPRIELSDVAERHQMQGRPDAEHVLVDCPICNTPHCSLDVNATVEQPETKGPARNRRPPARRVERPLPVEPDRFEDPNRLVVAKVDKYDDVVYPGCIDAVQVLAIVKGQRLPYHEAVARDIEWQEEDGPDSFEVSFKDGTPVIMEPSRIIFVDDDFVPPEEREDIE